MGRQLSGIGSLALAVLLSVSLTGCEGQADSDAKPADSVASAEVLEGAEKPVAEGEHGLVTMGLEAQKTVKLTLQPISRQALTTILATTGELVASPNAVAYVSPRITGRITALYRQIGDRVSVGTTLATLSSQDVAQAQTQYLQALSDRSLAEMTLQGQKRIAKSNLAQVQTRLNLAKSVLDRQRRLFAEDIAARKEVQQAENEYQQAQIEYQRQELENQKELQKAQSDQARAQSAVEGTANGLRVLGFNNLKGLASSRRIDPTLALTSPIAGIVTERTISLGQTVEPTTSAFTVTNTASLWAEARLNPQDLEKVRVGQQATITVGAYPDRTYSGRVVNISSTLDKETRTAKARVVVNNPDGKLKPEMFVNVRLALGEQSVLAVPKSAVHDENKQHFVYVPVGSEQFKEKPIKVGTEYAEYFQVVSGLQSGEKVVTQGSFDLLAQARKSTFGEEE